MYPVIPIGPLSLPTVPFIALLAIWLGLGALARTGREVELDPDQLWNFGLLALGAGFIVARLWHVVQFWAIYRIEWTLIFSPRPGAFAFWPGLIAALVAGYSYLIWKRLDPIPVGAALSVGLLVAGGLLEIGAFLTSTTVGTPSDLPWALAVFDVTRHPVALYRAAGMFGLAGLLFWRGDFSQPRRIVGWAIFGYALLRLLADGFLADAATISGIRISQLVALAVALGAVMLLSGSAFEEAEGQDG
ncbi:MAG: prolipoprotein diacylglyceryl transferase [Caldilineaceae bacterium]|nr:prolipoprotein diacylglyceryl transferase [Caldilineaceae bacterium]